LVRVKPREETDVHRIEDSYRLAYLTGKKSLRWMIGIIRSSSLRGSKLLAALDRIDKQIVLDESSKKRVDELRRELERLGFI